jgi:hypothetical protein
MSQTHECFYCGRYFTRADSLAANTPEEFASTYCSLMHKDLDTEQMKQGSEQDVKIAESCYNAVENPIDSVATESKQVGGFTIKIKQTRPKE